MSRSFTLPRAHVLASHGIELLTEVARHTGSEAEAQSILRSLERLGDDPSIERYEVTTRSEKLGYRGSPAVVWSVRAVRD